MSDHIVIDVPLHHRHATTVRAVTASVAAAAGWSVDAIDDLRLGVNEAISLLTDVDPDGHVDARLAVRFDRTGDEITVVASRTGVAGGPPELDELAGRILAAVVDDVSVDDDGSVRIRKQVAADGAA